MSASRWKYWIGDDGLAHINQADMPLPVALNVNPGMLNATMNPDYYEFKAEILRVTGSSQFIVHPLE
jgi:hypothetical protein